tara:strand:+ start:39925 stop:40314 length:390 start_codon:yes stop_codon:yes gene_type:complete
MKSMKLIMETFQRRMSEPATTAGKEYPPADKIDYEDYDRWDSDPNLERIENILQGELELKDFEFVLDTDTPGQYKVANRGDLMGLKKKTGYDLEDVERVLQANGYKVKFGYGGVLTALDPQYFEDGHRI